MPEGRAASASLPPHRSRRRWHPPPLQVLAPSEEILSIHRHAFPHTPLSPTLYSAVAAPPIRQASTPPFWPGLSRERCPVSGGTRASLPDMTECTPPPPTNLPNPHALYLQPMAPSHPPTLGNARAAAATAAGARAAPAVAGVAWRRARGCPRACGTGCARCGHRGGRPAAAAGGGLGAPASRLGSRRSLMRARACIPPGQPGWNIACLWHAVHSPVPLLVPCPQLAFQSVCPPPVSSGLPRPRCHFPTLARRLPSRAYTPRLFTP